MPTGLGAYWTQWRWQVACIDDEGDRVEARKYCEQLGDAKMHLQDSDEIAARVWKDGDQYGTLVLTDGSVRLIRGPWREDS